MATTVEQVKSAFALLYSNLISKEFSKSKDFKHWTERDLLLMVRTFLLGYFGNDVQAEVSAKLPSASSGIGRLDFLIGDVAVEFAVRTPSCPSNNLAASKNSTEVEKLLKFDGLALLVLFDFTQTEPVYLSGKVEEFRRLPSLGQGNHRKSPFSVAYFHLDFDSASGWGVICKQIRVC